jgi:hypothetical protein
MKHPDVTSTVLAGVFGAIFVFLLVRYWTANKDASWYYPAVGFIAGALVQIAVRLTGVS